MQRRWTVSPHEAGQRLGTFLADKLDEGYSGKQIKRWIDENQCVVNGQTERFASRKLRGGERIELHLSQTSTDVQVGVVYSDADLLAVSKPPAVTSESLLKHLTQEGTLYLVHRLDKDTSGILLFARTIQTQHALEELFRQRLINKSYLAIVVGAPKESEGVRQSYLGKVRSFDGQTIYGSVGYGSGRYAETAWRVLQRSRGCALVLCMPATGRTHQLRVHLKELGCPILGDYQYAREQQAPTRPTRHMLHAWKLAFPHPSTGKRMELVAPIPKDFEDICVQFGIAGAIG